MPVKDGPSCPGCGLSNYEGLCPHCTGDAEAYERELVPPFLSIQEQEDRLAEQRKEDDDRRTFAEGFAEHEHALASELARERDGGTS